MKTLEKRFLVVIICWISFAALQAQGPPITGDKPIMLSKGNIVLKTLSEYRVYQDREALIMPLMVHYIPSKNVLLGIHIPYVNVNSSSEDMTNIGDIQLLAKYQFYRKDQMAKTFRVVAKTYQWIPAKHDLNVEEVAVGSYRSFYSVLAGLETIKFGVSNELGFAFDAGGEHNLVRYKLGFGLPLKKPVYPVDQVNLYFEYQNDYRFNDQGFSTLYAQGVQYAKGRWTMETSIQFPLIQYQIPEALKRKYSFFVGIRYVI